MDHFDLSSIAVPSSIGPIQIKRLREMHDASQRVFAQQLNVSKSTVQNWESGIHKPGPSALKLLSIVEKHGLKILA